MMSGWEIAGGIVLLVVSALIVLFVALQESPKGGGLNALTGADSYYNKNQGRTRDAMLSRGTKIMAVVLFLVTIAVYFINLNFK